MRKMNVKYVLVALSLMAFAFTTNTYAEDVAAQFVARCTKGLQLDPACCELMLKTYSDDHRDMVKRELPELEKSTEKLLIKILETHDITKEEIDTVYSLFDSAQEQEILYRLAMGAGDSSVAMKHRVEHKRLLGEFGQLEQTYKTDPLRDHDISRYCGDKYKVNQMKKDLKDDDGKLFPSVKRDLELSAMRVYQKILQTTQNLECRKKKAARIKEPAKTTAYAEPAKTKPGKDSQAKVMSAFSPERSETSAPKSDNAESSAPAQKGYEWVYEKCVNQLKLNREFDCECMAQNVVVMHSKQRPDYPFDDLLLTDYVRRLYVDGACRNISGTSRLEYETCMTGTGFDYRDIPQKDYCECYSDAWGKFYGEYEGRIDENRKSSIRLKARSYCYRPEAYK